MPVGGLVIDLCAGPGGWDLAARQLGLDPIGFELDAATCATRRNAGLRTVQIDVHDMDPFGELDGLIASCPCTHYSMDGGKAGLHMMEQVTQLIRDEFSLTTNSIRQRHRAWMSIALHDAKWPLREGMSAEERKAVVAEAVSSAALMGVPARFIRAAKPGWVALEQVPAVLPLFQEYATLMQRLGYSTWCGVLNAADCGLGQIRRRAILIGSLDRPVRCPPPTHYDPARGAQFWGQPWVSMADVLGWGATHRPSPTVTAGGIKSGGPEPFGHMSREALIRERDAGRWIPRPGSTSLRPTPEECARLQGFPPEFTFTGNAGQRVQQAGNAVPPPLALAVLSMATGIFAALEAS